MRLIGALVGSVAALQPTVRLQRSTPHVVMCTAETSSSIFAKAVPLYDPLSDSWTDQPNLEEAAKWMEECNLENADELKLIAKRINDADGVDWSVEELSSARIIGVDTKGITLEEILCSTTDQRCIAVPLQVRWPSTPPRTAEEMRVAFAELSSSAFADPASEDALPQVYAAQQKQLDGMMAFMNAQFGKLLKFYALRQAREAFSPTEECERARLTQLNFDGLSLELETIELGDESVGQRMQRRKWSTSVLFDTPCTSPEEVEDRLVGMFAERADDVPIAKQAPAAEEPLIVRSWYDDGIRLHEGEEEEEAPADVAVSTIIPTKELLQLDALLPSGFVWGGVY